MTITKSDDRGVMKTNLELVPINYVPFHHRNWPWANPLVSLVVIGLLIDQWDCLLRFKFSVGCKLLDI